MPKDRQLQQTGGSSRLPVAADKNSGLSVSPSVASILELQRTAGNAAVATMVADGRLASLNPFPTLQRASPTATLDKPTLAAADAYPGCQPRILKVEADSVTVLNAAGAAETISLTMFQNGWSPKNPGNPATWQSNAAYEQAYRQILAKAGIPVTGPDVSWELAGAPKAATPAQRVKLWLRDHAAEIEAAESAFMVDRRAIAGAIAWEALMNVRRSMRAYGPGKVHAWTWSGKTVAEEVEDKGDLPKKTTSEREALLATPAGSITYIAAIMNAGAETAAKHGFSIRRNPAILCFFFNAMDLPKWEAHLAAKKPGTSLEPGPMMGGWVAENMKYIEDITGKTALPAPPSAAPVQRDKKADTVPPPAPMPSLGWDDEGPNKAGAELVNGQVWRYAVKGLPAPVSEAIVLVPASIKEQMKADPKRAVDVLIHLHGYGIGMRARTAAREKAAGRQLPADVKPGQTRDVALDRLEDQLGLLAQERTIVAILPQAQAYHSEFGEAEFDRTGLMTNVFQSLEKLGVAMPAPGGVILSGHSGAGRTLSKVLGKEAKRPADQQLEELILFDAINGLSELTPVTDWIKQRLQADLTNLSKLAAGSKDPTTLLTYLGTSSRFRGYCTHNKPNSKSPRYVDFFMGTKFKFESVQQTISRWFAKEEAQAFGPDVARRWQANYAVTDVEAKGTVGHEQMMGKGNRFVEALTDWDQLAASEWPRLSKEAQARFPGGLKQYRQMLPDNFKRLRGDPVGWLNTHAATEETSTKTDFDALAVAQANASELRQLRKVQKQTKQIARLEVLKSKPKLTDKEKIELNKLKPLEAKLARLKQLEGQKPEADEKAKGTALAGHWQALAWLQWPQLKEDVRGSFNRGLDQYIDVLPLYYKRLNGASPVGWLNSLVFDFKFCGEPLRGLDPRVIDKLKPIEADCLSAVNAAKQAKAFVKFEGAFQPRAVTGNASALSDHALGLAMHLNYERDPYVRDTAVVKIIERATQAEGMTDFSWKGLSKNGGSREAHIEWLFGQYAGASDALGKYFGQIPALEQQLALAKSGRAKGMTPSILATMQKDVTQRREDLALLKKKGSDFAGRDPSMGFFAHVAGTESAKDPVLQIVKQLTLKAELQWGGEYTAQAKDLHHYAFKGVG